MEKHVLTSGISRVLPDGCSVLISYKHVTWLVYILINHPIKTSPLFYYKITSFVYWETMADDDRFAIMNKAEMDDIVENIEAANTKKQTNTAVRTCE